MRRTRELFTLAAAALLLATGPAIAQRGGGRQTGGRAGAQSGQPARQPSGQPAGQRVGDDTGQRVHVDDATRDRAHDCTQAATDARRTAGALTRTRSFDSAKAIGQADRLRAQVDSMFARHERFESALAEGQRQALAQRLQDLDRYREGIESGLGSLQTRLREPSPDPARVATQARELKKQIRTWQKTYRRLEGALGPA